ncbi:hypothetical protein [Pseudohongiella nitratireducens]|uniref:hypothetical protein n=1 Tax=Pseudohongiella nitratireducens TaxID=1768907 RepID=UPI0030EC1037|tara:strand:+ start:7034 stop:7759 length:726 start_codon:yes stop_codon:yes gene_type:complete
MMQINDEILSAMLDGELDAEQTQEVNHAMVADPKLAARFAELAAANASFVQSAKMIDEAPMPDAVTRLLESAEQDSNVADLQAFRQLRKPTHNASNKPALRWAALAASLALAVGLAGGNLLGTGSSSHALSPAVADALNSVSSGEQVEIGSTESMLAGFSFVDTDERFCRQFSVNSQDGSSNQIACRDGEDWEQVAVIRSTEQLSESYQPASANNQALDGVLDTIMVGAPLSLEEEARWLD